MIDIDSICKELRVRPEIYKKILTDFAHGLPEKMAALNEAITSADSKKVREIAHEIKGISSNLRVTKIKGITTSIHNCCTEEGMDKIKVLMEDLKKEAEQLENFVNNP